MRTILSCDVGFRRYSAYLAQDKRAKALFKELGYSKSIWVTLLAVPRILRAVVAAWHMPTKWPWVPPDVFQRRSLYELRVEYGIRAT